MSERSTKGAGKSAVDILLEDVDPEVRFKARCAAYAERRGRDERRLFRAIVKTLVLHAKVWAADRAFPLSHVVELVRRALREDVAGAPDMPRFVDELEEQVIAEAVEAFARGRGRPAKGRGGARHAALHRLLVELDLATGDEASTKRRLERSGIVVEIRAALAK